MKKINMTISQFMEMERGNLTLNEIIKTNCPAPIDTTTILLLLLLLSTYLIGITSVLPTIAPVDTTSDTVIEAFKFSTKLI